MEAWWIVLAIVALALIGIVFLVQRRSRGIERLDAAPPTADRDYPGERETFRRGTLSVEDQAWQAASLEKDRANRQQTPPAPSDE